MRSFFYFIISKQWWKVATNKVFIKIIGWWLPLEKIHIQQSFHCLFGVYHPTEKCFTNMEMSPWPVKGCNLWPMLGTHGHRAVRILKRATSSVTRDIRLWRSSPRTRDTRTFYRAFRVELSLPVFTTYGCRGWDLKTQPSAFGSAL